MPLFTHEAIRAKIGILVKAGVLLFFPVLASAQPANNLCGNATTLTPAHACLNTAGTLTAATYTAGIGLPGCGAAVADVWYRFVASSATPTITVAQTSGIAGLRRSQLFSGTCASLTSLACSGDNNVLLAVGLVPGQTYYVRVYSNGAAFNFTICITDPHNVCTSAVTLTSRTVCSNIPGNMYGSTLTAPTTISAPDCAAALAPTRDIWYRFVAQTLNPTITLSSVGVNFTGNCRMQLLSNNCGGTFTSYYCGTTSIAANHLTPGTTYFIRVYSTTVAAPITTVGWEFNICIQDPVTPAPFNDNCSNAVNLPIWNSCNNIPGSVAGATASAIPLGGTCTGPLAYDVWYKFTAVNATATVTLSSIGTNFVNPRLEILSGSCSAPVSIACGVSPLAVAGLVAGSVYFIRVYSTTAPPPNGDARFNICVSTTNAPVRFGNSYVNITKKRTGGVVEPGDTLEIRMTINHTSGTMFNLRYVDNVPTKTTMLTAGTNRIRVITNEGLAYKQYTLTAGDDAATFKATPAAGEYNIRMNLAFGATAPGTPTNNTAIEFASATGQMASGDRPRGGGGLLFATAFRVKVTGVIGDTITLFPGQFLYKTAAGAGADVILTATPFKILISQPYSLCTNSIGINNAAELGGTFGSGNTLTRSFDLSSPIAGYSFISEVNAYTAVNDGRYSIVKNISPRSGTQRNARQIPNCNAPSNLAWDDPFNCNNRMFNGHWDIDGDHSGTANSIGNSPPDGPTPGGYMLMVNADYVASEIFRQNITNLCPNTYYEFSAWIRNICQTCGIDSTGAQFAGTVTAPANGYPGVYPNLSFALNDIDRYNTGEVDTLGWMKKGFMFRTGPTQTSAVFSIRNNSQGGGGNDWTLDDIAVATCLPTMAYSPTINPNVCATNSIMIADTVTSFFNNYTTFKWQRSVNGGASWTDVTGVITLPDTTHYITNYTVPPSATNLADSGDLYRVVVATTAANLVNPNCNISDGVTITLHVLDCSIVLDADLLSFNGKLVNSKANLSWSTSHEDVPVKFIIERSDDGRSFLKVGELSGYNNNDNINYYSFIDPQSVVNRSWYRIAMVATTGKTKYSSVIQLSNTPIDFDVTNLINPFAGNLSFDVTVAENSVIACELIDISGKTVSLMKQMAHAGINNLTLNTASLPVGIYTLRVADKNKYIIKRVVKNN